MGIALSVDFWWGKGDGDLMKVVQDDLWSCDDCEFEPIGEPIIFDRDTFCLEPI